jgi:hypothetical protein
MHEWNRLKGFDVDVFRHGRFVRSGTVAEVAPDCSAIWIAARGVDGRMLVHREEGYLIGIDDESLAKLQMRS